MCRLLRSLLIQRNVIPGHCQFEKRSLNLDGAEAYGKYSALRSCDQRTGTHPTALLCDRAIQRARMRNCQETIVFLNNQALRPSRLSSPDTRSRVAGGPTSKCVGVRDPCIFPPLPGIETLRNDFTMRCDCPVLTLTATPSRPLRQNPVKTIPGKRSAQCCILQVVQRFTCGFNAAPPQSNDS